MSAISDDYDTPWKDAVTRYFPEFMAFYFPHAHAQIDWLRPHVFLEQEPAQVVRDAGLGKRRVDKLVRVARLVFALVTAAHLLTQQSKGNDVQRHLFKWRLVRLLYQRDWDRQRVVDLFGVIDWMMRLPMALQSGLMRDIDEMERRCEMPYMNPFEVRGLKEGRKAGRKEGRTEGHMEGRVEILESILEARFGVLPKETKERLAQASGKSLAAWARAALDAPTLDQVFCVR